MKKSILALVLFGGVILWSLQPALARSLEDEIRELKARLEELEKRLEEQSVAVEEQKTEIAEVKKTKGIIDTVSERIEFHGLAEAGWRWHRLGHSRGGPSLHQSDIQLTTIEMGIEGSVFDWLSFNLLPLYEEPSFDEPIFMDEASVTIGGTEKCPFYLTTGKLYLPYGRLYTRFPDDPFVNLPVTLEFGETRDSAAILGVSKYGLTLEGYLFNGNLVASREHHFNNFGFDASYSISNGDYNLEIGGSYISLLDAWNIANTISGAYEEEGLLCFCRGVHGGLGPIPEELDHEVGGAAAYLSAEVGNAFLTGEFMTTDRAYAPDELPRWNYEGAHPQVWNIEAGYNFENIFPKPLEFVFKYAGSKDCEALGVLPSGAVGDKLFTTIPKNRWGACLNIGIAPYTTCSLAYAYDRYGRAFDFGTPDISGFRDQMHLLFSQIAVEF